MSGAIAMGANKITGLTNGTAAQDVAAFNQVPFTGYNAVSANTNASTTSGQAYFMTGAHTITLPSSIPPVGWNITIISLTAATTVNPGATLAVNGVAGAGMFVDAGGSVTLVSDGSAGYWTVTTPVDNTANGFTAPAPGLSGANGTSGYAAAANHGHGGFLYASGNPATAVGTAATTYATSPSMAVGTWLVFMSINTQANSATLREIVFSLANGSGSMTYDTDSTLNMTMATLGANNSQEIITMMGEVTISSTGTVKFNASTGATGQDTILYYTFFALRVA
jgi:hypothetical protein